MSFWSEPPDRRPSQPSPPASGSRGPGDGPGAGPAVSGHPRKRGGREARRDRGNSRCRPQSARRGKRAAGLGRNGNHRPGGRRGAAGGNPDPGPLSAGRGFPRGDRPAGEDRRRALPRPGAHSLQARGFRNGGQRDARPAVRPDVAGPRDGLRYRRKNPRRPGKHGRSAPPGRDA